MGIDFISISFNTQPIFIILCVYHDRSGTHFPTNVYIFPSVASALTHSLFYVRVCKVCFIASKINMFNFLCILPEYLLLTLIKCKHFKPVKRITNCHWNICVLHFERRRWRRWCRHVECETKRNELKCTLQWEVHRTWNIRQLMKVALCTNHNTLKSKYTH